MAYMSRTGTSDVWTDDGACSTNGKETAATQSRPEKSSRFFRF